MYQLHGLFCQHECLARTSEKSRQNLHVQLPSIFVKKQAGNPDPTRINQTQMVVPIWLAYSRVPFFTGWLGLWSLSSTCRDAGGELEPPRTSPPPPAVRLAWKKGSRWPGYQSVIRLQPSTRYTFRRGRTGRAARAEKARPKPLWPCGHADVGSWKGSYTPTKDIISVSWRLMKSLHHWNLPGRPSLTLRFSASRRSPA